MSLRMSRMERTMAYGTRACGFEDAMLGTFINPDNRSEPGVFGSTEFTPEIADEEKRVVRGDRLRRFVPLEDIPANAVKTIPLFPKLSESLESALYKVLAAGPHYAILVYIKARDLERDDILMLLPRLIRQLVGDGVYDAQKFQETGGVGQSHYRTLKGYARVCPIANSMFKALTATV